MNVYAVRAAIVATCLRSVMLRKHFLSGCAVFVACLVQPYAARAQAVANAQINGRVLDPSGAVVPNAPVRATQTETQRRIEVQSNGQGEYVLNNLPVGHYVLSIEMPGFKQYQRLGLDLHVGDNVQVNVSLDIGEARETVSVTTAASDLDTTQRSIRQVFQ